jgi:hypothetical protein
MNKNFIITLLCVFSLVFLLMACGASEPDIPEDAALVIVGNVEKEIGWLEETIRAMDTIDVESTNSSGDSELYTGVSIRTLMENAVVNPEATSIIFISDDGKSSGEIPVSDVITCENCIVSFRTKGGFSIVAPDLGKDAQIKGVIRIDVK